MFIASLSIIIACHTLRLTALGLVLVNHTKNIFPVKAMLLLIVHDDHIDYYY